MFLYLFPRLITKYILLFIILLLLLFILKGAKVLLTYFCTKVCIIALQVIFTFEFYIIKVFISLEIIYI